jgi:hypothetical protein
MSNKETGGPAFPSMRDMRHNPDFDHEEGMTLRDYFAAKAMQVLIIGIDPRQDHQPALIPYAAYEMADAMLKARQA